MSIFKKGILYGCNSISQAGIRGHYRQAHHDFGSLVIEHNVWMDNVEPNVGEGNNISNICGIQLPSSENQRKEYK
jgi:hypothetical protein